MAKGCYIGVDSVAKKVKKGYIGVDGVAKKIKKAYIGDENGIARLCWESSVPYITGTKSISSASNTLSITGLNFTPAYVFCFNPNSSSSSNYSGIIGTVPSSGGALCNDIPSRVSVHGQNTYSNGTLTLKAVTSGGSTKKFDTGSYYYTLVGSEEDDNILYGTFTTSAAASSIKMDIGTGKKIVDVKLYYNSTSNSKQTMSGCSYAVYNNNVYYANYDSEIGFYGAAGQYATKYYNLSNGVLTFNSYSNNYPFYKGTYYYCIVLEDEV